MQNYPGKITVEELRARMVLIGRNRQEKTHGSCGCAIFPCGNRQVSLEVGCEPPTPDKYCLPWNYVCHVCPFARFISHRPSSFTFRPSFNWSWLTATERVKTQMLLQCVVLRSSAPFDPGRIVRKEERSGSILPERRGRWGTVFSMGRGIEMEK